MNNALTAYDISDLFAVADGVRETGGRRSLRRSELDDDGDLLLGLGLVYVSEPALHGIPGSARLEVTDAGLDELFERDRAARLRRAAHARLAA